MHDNRSSCPGRLDAGADRQSADHHLDPTSAFPDLKQYLNLSDSQVTSLQNIAQQKAMSLQQIAAQIAQKSQTLQTLLTSINPNPTTVGQTMIDIQNLEKQLTPSTEPYHTQALAVLTTSQTALLTNLTTALQLQTPACEAVNLNLLVLPSPTPINGAVAVAPLGGCGVVPIFTPTPLPPARSPPCPAAWRRHCRLLDSSSPRVANGGARASRTTVPGGA